MCKIEETTDRFKVGDFVYDCNDYRKPVYRIEEIVDNSYICKKVDDESAVLHFDTNNPYLRLWTVKNATNGDVIVDDLDNIILFRKIGNNAFDDVVDYHCAIFNNDTFYVQDGNSFFSRIEDTFFPATKEQRERLFNKIKENNYVWNSEEKRLSKAEKHKPKFKVGDWIMDKDGELLYQVQAVKDSEYWLTDTTNLPFDAENNWRLWRVGDIKDGDILSYNTDEGQKWIMIYEESKYEVYGVVRYHALFTGKDFIKHDTCFIDIDKLQPASYKEEEVIFRLLEQNGLVWDNKQKKLIENKVSEHKTTYVDINKVCEYLYEWNRKQVEKFGSRATLGCYDFTINVREMLEEINS